MQYNDLQPVIGLEAMPAGKIVRYYRRLLEVKTTREV